MNMQDNGEGHALASLKRRFARLHGREPTAADLAPPPARRLDAVSVADQLLAMGQVIIAARALGFDVEPVMEGMELDVRCTHPECEARTADQVKDSGPAGPHRWVFDVTQPVQADDTTDAEREQLAHADGVRLLSVLQAHHREHTGEAPPPEQNRHPSHPDPGPDLRDAADVEPGPRPIRTAERPGSRAPE